MKCDEAQEYTKLNELLGEGIVTMFVVSDGRTVIDVNVCVRTSNVVLETVGKENDHRFLTEAKMFRPQKLVKASNRHSKRKTDIWFRWWWKVVRVWYVYVWELKMKERHRVRNGSCKSGRTWETWEISSISWTTAAMLGVGVAWLKKRWEGTWKPERWVISMVQNGEEANGLWCVWRLCACPCGRSRVCIWWCIWSHPDASPNLSVLVYPWVGS